jgi:hypothetical protein
MTPKQRYDERKRLKAERLHRQEKQWQDEQQKRADDEARFESVMNAIERIADVAELWADKQK